MTLENINIDGENNMKMMIPNKVALGLDFSDLPTRAKEVSPEELILAGGRRGIGCRWFTNRDRRPRSACPAMCRGTSRKFWGGGTRTNGGRRRDCFCCRKARQ